MAMCLATSAVYSYAVTVSEEFTAQSEYSGYTVFTELPSLAMPTVFTACVPEGMRPICGQCRRDVEPGGRRHLADGTPRCPEGAADAWRALVALLCGQASA